jgi:hypothetical protein
MADLSVDSFSRILLAPVVKSKLSVRVGLQMTFVVFSLGPASDDQMSQPTDNQLYPKGVTPRSATRG